MRTPSPDCFNLIKQFEGLRLDAYPDPVYGWKVPTIGYGHTGGVKQGDRITRDQADALLARDVLSFGRQVDAWVDEDVVLTQAQYDALVSFAYNVKDWQHSTLFRHVHNCDFKGAAEEFQKWAYAGRPAKILPGLVTRRKAERDLFERV